MSDKSTTLEGLLARRPASEIVTTAASTASKAMEDDAIDTIGPCRFGRLPQMMLSFVKASGVVEVYAYSMLARIRADDPSRAFDIQYPTMRVTIEGENLLRLFDYVCLHRAIAICEWSRTEALAAGGSTPVVHNIEFNGN